MIIQYLKRKYPNQVFLGRGNHEGVDIEHDREGNITQYPLCVPFSIIDNNSGYNKYSEGVLRAYSTSKELLEFYNNLSLGFNINGNCALHGGLVRNFSKKDVIIHGIETVLKRDKNLRESVKFDFEFFKEYGARVYCYKNDFSESRYTFDYILSHNADMIEYLLNPDNITAKQNVLKKIGCTEEFLENFKQEVGKVVNLQKLREANSFPDIVNCINKPWLSETTLTAYVLWSNLKEMPKDETQQEDETQEAQENEIRIDERGRFNYTPKLLKGVLQDTGFSGIIVGHDHGNGKNVPEMNDEFKKVITFTWNDGTKCIRPEVGIVSKSGDVAVIKLDELENVLENNNFKAKYFSENKATNLSTSSHNQNLSEISRNIDNANNSIDRHNFNNFHTRNSYCNIC